MLSDASPSAYSPRSMALSSQTKLISCELVHVLKAHNFTVPLNHDSSVPIVDDELIVMGMGVTREGGNSSQILLEAAVDYVDPNECSGLITALNVSEDVMLCAYRENADRYVPLLP